MGREQLETGYAVKQLSQAGVQIFSYLDGRELLLETPTDKFLMSAMIFAAEIGREKARQRTRDAMLQENHGARRLYEKHGFLAVRFGMSPPPENVADVEYHWRPGLGRHQKPADLWTNS